MANRQKSFFDQDPKPRSLWREDWKHRHEARVPQPPYKPTTPLAPIAASSQSKSKLDAFRYEQKGTKSKMSLVDKENVDLDQGKTTSQLIPPPQTLSQHSAKEGLQGCPQTPLGRLPLSELLASGEDTSRQHLNFTPIERVLWDNSPVGSITGLTARRKRKRAHSSSPASSSSQNEASKHFPEAKSEVDLHTLQKALKTPKADPADDLWNRYTFNAEPIGRRSPMALGYTHLMRSSSPQTPATHLQRESGGLRRALSCIEWPTSVAKRRKLHHSSSQGDNATNGGTVPMVEKSKLSRVSVLVEKIHSGLSKPVTLHDEDDSSEPAVSSPAANGNESPSKRSIFDQRSPLAINRVANVLSQATVTSKGIAPQPLILTEHEMTKVEMDGCSSDLGDNDFDLEMLETIDSEIDSMILNHPARPGTKEKQADDELAPSARQNTKDIRRVSGCQTLPPAGSSQCDDYFDLSLSSHIPSLNVDRPLDGPDEYGEDEDEVFAANIEEIFAKYDSQLPHSHIMAEPNGRVIGKKSNSTEGPVSTPSKMKTTAVKPEVLSDDDNEFGNDSDFEQIAVECAEATQEWQMPRPKSSYYRDDSIIQRYIIKAIAESEYEAGNGHTQPEKVLSVRGEQSKLSQVVLLRQAWIDSPCSPGSFIHVVGNFDRFGQCVIDNSQNLLVLHPDHLISSTVVGDSFTCTRKAVLQDRVKATSDANQGTIYGHILHEIFQESMRANRWDDEFMSTTIETLASQYLESLFEIQIESITAVEHLKTRVNDLQAWAEIFVSAKPKTNAMVRDRNGAQSLMSINKLLEVEEKVWSPLYGLKGNIDATVQVLLKNGNEERTLTVPFELKTGKHQSAAHKAQTSLYTLLLSDRYDVEIACGILYYMQSSEISNVPTLRSELVPLIMQRNELASHVRHRIDLPPMLKRAHVCGRCYAQKPCFIYHKLVDDGNGETSGMGDVFEGLVKHLNSDHQQFFSKWDTLLTKEEKDVVKFHRELWTMQSSEREKVGRCFGDVIIEPESFHKVEGAPKINRFQYNFIKQVPTPGFSFTESQITLGEPIVVSDQKGHFALANGYVTSVRKNKIQVTVDRRLHNARAKDKNFDAERYQSFAGIMEVVEEIGKSSSILEQPQEPVIYRLDKDEFSNGMALVRNNLIRLMEKDVFGVQALRRLIVEGAAPTFKPAPSQYMLANTASQASLNVDQKAAIEKVMSAKDYALVLGMPGTGKTTTIAHIIRALVAQGKSVLLTSYTHTAVDNILLKLRKDNIGIFRLGTIAKVHPEVQQFASLAGKPMKTIEELKECYLQPIVATTCLGINHPIFNQRIFDYCIVDEASQITLPVCLGPIRMARTFILVGDHNQLPPLVQNDEAKEGGLDISLFKTLSDKNPSSVVNLEHQYRMCADIMTLSNTLVYSGRLKCGTAAIADRTMTIPNMPALSYHHHTPVSLPLTSPRQKVCSGPHPGSCWLRDLLCPSVKACFINTDPLNPYSFEHLDSGGSRITNPCEATLTTQLVEALLTTGVPPTEVGVITMYRSQLALIKQSLRCHPGVEMHTADRFQGRDKEVVVLSLVRSNTNSTVGELLRDWRRVNVALTRARSKLLILGSKSTLVGNELLKDLITLMEGRGWWYELPAGACEGHVFEEGGMQVPAKINGEARREEKAQAKGLHQGKEHRIGRSMPDKQGKIDMNRLLGKRPVLRDIVNEAS